MNMKQLCMAGVLVLGSACAVQKADEDMIPVAKAITIYSDCSSVVSGIIDTTAVGARRLRLPATAAAINLSQGDESLKWFTVQASDEPKKDDTKKPEETYKLIGLPELKPGVLRFNYALPDITWSLQLRAEIVDPKSVSLQLLAAV